jgi:hypothetical protein
MAATSERRIDMSWYVCLVGAREAVRAKAAQEFDKQASYYESQPEEKADIMACKDRALAVIDRITALGIKVEASGSRSGENHMNMRCEISAVPLVV